MGTIVSECFVELTVAGMKTDSCVKTFPYQDQGEEQFDGFVGLRSRLMKWREELTEEKRAVGHYEDQVPKIDKGQYGQYEHFRKCILSGSPVATDVIRGAIPTLIAWKAMESLEKGRVIDLNLSEFCQTAIGKRHA